MPSAENDLERQLLALERSLLRPEVRASWERVSAFLDDDFVEHGASGTTYDKQRTLEALAAAPSRGSDATASVMDFRVRRLSAEVVLVTYRLVEADGASLRSSVWCLRQERWRLVFHQGTNT